MKLGESVPVLCKKSNLGEAKKLSKHLPKRLIALLCNSKYIVYLQFHGVFRNKHGVVFFDESAFVFVLLKADGIRTHSSCQEFTAHVSNRAFTDVRIMINDLAMQRKHCITQLHCIIIVYRINLPQKKKKTSFKYRLKSHCF